MKQITNCLLSEVSALENLRRLGTNLQYQVKTYVEEMRGHLGAWVRIVRLQCHRYLIGKCCGCSWCCKGIRVTCYWESVCRKKDGFLGISVPDEALVHLILNHFKLAVSVFNISLYCQTFFIIIYLFIQYPRRSETNL